MRSYEETPEETALPTEGEADNEMSNVEGTPTLAPDTPVVAPTVESVDFSPITATLELIRQDQTAQYLVVAQIAQRDREINYGLLALVALLLVYTVIRDFLKG